MIVSRLPKWICLFALLSFLTLSFGTAESDTDRPPLNFKYLEKYAMDETAVKNLLSMDQIHRAVKADYNLFMWDFKHITHLENGMTVNPRRFSGFSYIGPYPLESQEAAYDVKRFRRKSGIWGGWGEIPMYYLYLPGKNAEDWGSKGTFALRLELWYEMPNQDLYLGKYDTFVSFTREKNNYFKIPSIIAGPGINLVRSETPGELVISYDFSEAITSKVHVRDDDGEEVGTYSSNGAQKSNEIDITGLEADEEYEYKVEYGMLETKWYPFKTAPKKGKSGFKFAFTGDSRTGVGGGERTLMGVNALTMERLCNIAYNRDTEFLLFGGDLIDGYTVSPEDYNMQFNAWKQAVSAYRRSKSIYTIMGNHECLSNNYITGKKYGLSVDKWPYDTMSSEVLFARNFVNPTNGPKQEHKGRPSYTESVYSYQYGNVKFVCLNNNYWVSYLPHKTGGSPEGYFFQDQIKWLERQLEAAEDDRSVDHIIISMHEPMFPNGGHITDTMWYLGDNKWRGHTYDHEKGKLVPEQKGIIEVRNQIAKMVTNSSKVAVVLGSDEHSYSRLLIDENTPCGNLETDDKNGDNFLSWPDEQLSPIPDIGQPTWFVTCGGAGAPYYAEEVTSWNKYWREKDPSKFKYTSQENIIIFEVKGSRIGFQVLNYSGHVIDEVENLRSVKHRRRRR